jgi:hypothetical protein
LKVVKDQVATGMFLGPAASGGGCCDAAMASAALCRSCLRPLLVLLVAIVPPPVLSLLLLQLPGRQHSRGSQQALPDEVRRLQPPPTVLRQLRARRAPPSRPAPQTKRVEVVFITTLSVRGKPCVLRGPRMTDALTRSNPPSYVMLEPCSAHRILSRNSCMTIIANHTPTSLYQAGRAREQKAVRTRELARLGGSLHSCTQRRRLRLPRSPWLCPFQPHFV